MHLIYWLNCMIRFGYSLKIASNHIFDCWNVYSSGSILLSRYTNISDCFCDVNYGLKDPINIMVLCLGF